ncbi:hypothetical protein LOK49_LG02G01376 [Camellia lanceoleosa]|uniref:Uncharacterized protein n=1 Tax=Camellia lanceoleosa TaxID=1840588 RepID=A0ACC0IPG8_9ERIC|nr:hypothetical protein LOK49_LG02G01376 [Camellia lanceoleosa]
MANMSSFKALAVFFVVALFSAIASAQDSGMAPASAPGMDAGSAFSSPISAAVVCSSLALSLRNEVLNCGVSIGDRMDDGSYPSIVMETANPCVGTTMAAAIVKISVMEDRPLVVLDKAQLINEVSRPNSKSLTLAQAHTNSLADHDQVGPASTRPTSQPIVQKGTRRGMPTRAQIQTITGSRAHEAIGAMRGSR